MIEQTQLPPILNPEEIHLPLVILIDNSVHMGEENLVKLTDSINEFIRSIAEDDSKSSIVDILLAKIYNSALSPIGFEPACAQLCEQLKIENTIGITYDLLNETLGEQIRLYNRCGTTSYKVQIFLFVSDHSFANVKDILNIPKMCENSKYRVNIIGTKECTRETFEGFSSSKIILNDNDFKECFEWIEKEYFNELFCHYSFVMNGGYGYIPKCFHIIKDS